MGEFHELIKNFEKIRDYMRQFFVYGFKVRNEFTAKSARTYDDERRRVESYLKDFVHTEYTTRGKQVFISVDSRQIEENPLYAAWKSKSFTTQDLILHFFLPELLGDGKSLTASELADALSGHWGLLLDTQTIRLKLKEYEEEGVLESQKDKRSVRYRLAPPFPGDEVLLKKVNTAAAFYQGAAPFGFIGSTILEREGVKNHCFRFKHHYLVHTLEDNALYWILKAMREKREIRLENHSARTGAVTIQEGIPLKIFVSTQTGRRYVCVYKKEKRRFFNLRLDCAAKVELLSEHEEYEERRQDLKNNLSRCFGVSFQGGRRYGRMEEIFVKLHIDEKQEDYVLERLKREGRGGEILKAGENTFLYSGAFFDTNEVLPWLKSFIGRILDIQTSNPLIAAKLRDDLEKMYQMYF